MFLVCKGFRSPEYGHKFFPAALGYGINSGDMMKFLRGDLDFYHWNLSDAVGAFNSAS